MAAANPITTAAFNGDPFPPSVYPSLISAIVGGEPLRRLAHAVRVRHHQGRVRRHLRDDRRGMDQRDRPQAGRAHRHREPRGHGAGTGGHPDGLRARHPGQPGGPARRGAAVPAHVLRSDAGRRPAARRRRRPSRSACSRSLPRRPAPTCGTPSTTRRPRSSPTAARPTTVALPPVAIVAEEARLDGDQRPLYPDGLTRYAGLDVVAVPAMAAAEGLVYDRSGCYLVVAEDFRITPSPGLRPRLPAGQRGAAHLRPVRGRGAGPGREHPEVDGHPGNMTATKHY